MKVWLVLSSDNHTPLCFYTEDEARAFVAHVSILYPAITFEYRYSFVVSLEVALKYFKG